MTVLTAPARELIESNRLAHCVTLNADGSPQVSAVWIGLDGDEIVMAHLGAYQKVRNLMRDPRVALSIEADGSNDIGMQHTLVVYGRARIVEGGAPEWLQRLAYTYVGDVKFPPFDNPPPGYTVRITVDRVAGLGPWTEDG
jgi:PPOX class probable F420-dependent enzyme